MFLRRNNHFPTLQITQDKHEKGKMVGYKNYSELSQWLVDTLDMDPDVFSEHIAHEEGQVKKLTQEDFLSGFDGQWLLLFYKNKKDKAREYFKELSKRFKDKVSFGEANYDRLRMLPIDSA